MPKFWHFPITPHQFSKFNFFFDHLIFRLLSFQFGTLNNSTTRTTITIRNYTSSWVLLIFKASEINYKFGEIWLFLTDFADFIRKRSGDNKTSFIAVDSCKSISKGNKTLNLSTTMIWIVHELKHNFPSIELHIETFYTGRIFFFSTSASFLFSPKHRGTWLTKIMSN